MEKRSKALYERFHATAKRHLENNKLEDAERGFASALRQVYMQKNKLYQLAIALRGLGFVYKLLAEAFIKMQKIWSKLQAYSLLR